MKVNALRLKSFGLRSLGRPGEALLPAQAAVALERKLPHSGPDSSHREIAADAFAELALVLDELDRVDDARNAYSEFVREFSGDSRADIRKAVKAAQRRLSKL